MTNHVLFSYAESAKDEVEDVVTGGSTGNFIDRAQGSVEIEQEHFVRDPGRNGFHGGIQRNEGVMDELLVSHVCKKAGFLLRSSACRHLIQDRLSQSRNAFSSQGGS
jgi:hypothetical protein